MSSPRYTRVVAVMKEDAIYGPADGNAKPVLHVYIFPTTAPGRFEIIRVDIGAGQNSSDEPLNDIQEVTLYRANGASGSGASITEQIVNGAGVDTTDSRYKSTTTGGGTVPFLRTAFLWSRGYTYLPMPDERPMMNPGSGDQAFGFIFPVTVKETVRFSATIVYGEIEE